MRKTLVLLPGFLGHVKDFDFLKSYRVRYVDLCDREIFKPGKGLEEAGKQINILARNIPGEKVLLGYSLGGRLALHALIDDSSVWSKAVIISAHPGLEDKKEPRLEKDKRWAEKFKNEPWSQVLKEWNEQDVFKGFLMDRQECDYNKGVLAKVLSGWSLGRQKNLKEEIKKLKVSVLWVTGEDDLYFTSVANNLQFLHPLSTHCVIKKASHRLLWQQPKAFLEELNHFLKGNS